MPSTPLWVGTLLGVESLALAAAWGSLTIYQGRFHPDSPRLKPWPMVRGLVAGALIGMLLVIGFLLLDGSDSARPRRRRGTRQ
jgi:4-hydroxybenzoate polyprenyltransferase